ncbi:MAG: carbohydrate ABC transporter permease [Chloroflexi bacterium]|uniref:Carbohydrate ABC transporter permease n=2 Tax=Candidatus Thermofonsia Clade 3 TaxID=2364209 RepID=A0A2M8QB50_9CHLR|nr:MAG: carbohydrate ABC transporter permease [Candidatus Thermofonsia Clade 3 bacterium]RMG65715.1 MAG: carbohydrate ABC transporter permease [Chloroflexota bacterium]
MTERAISSSLRQRPAKPLHPMRTVMHLLRWVTVGLLLAFTLIPLIFMLTTSLKSPIEIRVSGSLLPSEGIFLVNWERAFRNVPLPRYLWNSLFVGIMSTTMTLLVAVPASYAIVRFRAGGRLLPSWILGTYVAPPIVISVPVFMLMRSVGLVDQPLGLALLHMVANLPVATWMLMDFVRSLPLEVEEAAQMDGASHWGVLLRIVIPLILPGLVATAIICLILSWNEFLFALILTYSLRSQTFPIGISEFQGEHGLQFGEISAAALTGIVPVYVLAMFFQRYLIHGLTRGSVK